jgi:CRISPR-associated protein Cmr2
LYAGSAIVARLVREATAFVAGRDGATVVFPDLGRIAADKAGVDGAPGLPNRIVALMPAGTGAAAARAAAGVVEACWSRLLAATFGGRPPTPADCPGMPSVQWVCVPPGGDYQTRFVVAVKALTARRRVRDFDWQQWPNRRLCGLSPRWPAVDPPAGLPAHEEDTLSAPNWVKRRWRYRRGESDPVRFPSTASIASAPFRRSALLAVADPAVRGLVETLRAASAFSPVREEAVPGLPPAGDDEVARWLAESAGPWVFPSAWDADRLRRVHEVADAEAVAARGGRAAAALRALVGAPLTAYLAVVVQDLDGLGRFLTGDEGAGPRIEVTPAEHTRVSQLLGGLSTRQRRVLRDEGRHGVSVYAGGDDLLAFTPASTALGAAQALHDLVPADVLPKASSAVLFFHFGSSLRGAVTQARQLLEQAKEAVPGKNGLAVGFLRRSGVRQVSVQPWRPRREDSHEIGEESAANLFEVFATHTGRRGLSPRLVTELERDGQELAGLGYPMYRAELARLVARHGGGPGDAARLARLGINEKADHRAGDGRVLVPVRAARVAVFLRQECAGHGAGDE